MAALTSMLPAPVRTYEVFPDKRAPAAAVQKPPPRQIPSYGKRQGFVPRTLEDYGDGGAFPEIHVAQFPLDMGRPGRATSTAIVPVNVDGKSGEARFDAIVLATAGDKKVQTRFSDLVEKPAESVMSARPGAEEEAAAAASTRAALESIVTAKVTHARPGYIPDSALSKAEQSTYIRYTPSEDTPGYNPAVQQRIVRLVEAAVDPLEPPKFKHKKVAPGPPDAPVPVLHSPPRKVTVADQQQWKIPPCVSNWKNARGYIVPLDKRLAADGRSLLEPTINDKFAGVAEALLIAERKARVEVETRAAIQKKLAVKEKEGKEAELRALAARARMERSGLGPPPPAPPSGHEAGAAVAGLGYRAQGREDGGGRHAGDRRRSRSESDNEYEAPAPRQSSESEAEYQARLARERLRAERKRERERDLRLEAAGKKGRTTRDADRDISERVALGMPIGKGMSGAESMFDTRLFNQSEGIASGFGDDEEYNVYSKSWRGDSVAAGIYRPRAAVGAVDPEATLAALQSQEPGKFRPHTDFEGVEKGPERSRGPRTEPVQFEKAAEADPFGVDDIIAETKGGRKNALDVIGKSSGHGFMAAVGGGVAKDADEYVGRGGGSRDVKFRIAGSER